MFRTMPIKKRNLVLALISFALATVMCMREDALLQGAGLPTRTPAPTKTFAPLGNAKCGSDKQAGPLVDYYYCTCPNGLTLTIPENNYNAKDVNTLCEARNTATATKPIPTATKTLIPSKTPTATKTLPPTKTLTATPASSNAVPGGGSAGADLCFDNTIDKNGACVPCRQGQKANPLTNTCEKVPDDDAENNADNNAENNNPSTDD